MGGSQSSDEEGGNGCTCGECHMGGMGDSDDDGSYEAAAQNARLAAFIRQHKQQRKKKAPTKKRKRLTKMERIQRMQQARAEADAAEAKAQEEKELACVVLDKKIVEVQADSKVQELLSCSLDAFEKAVDVELGGGSVKASMKLVNDEVKEKIEHIYNRVFHRPESLNRKMKSSSSSSSSSSLSSSSSSLSSSSLSSSSSSSDTVLCPLVIQQLLEHSIDAHDAFLDLALEGRSVEPHMKLVNEDLQKKIEYIYNRVFVVSSEESASSKKNKPSEKSIAPKKKKRKVG